MARRPPRSIRANCTIRLAGPRYHAGNETGHGFQAGSRLVFLANELCWFLRRFSGVSHEFSRTPIAMYSFDNTWERARERLRGIEARFDPGTIRHLEACGVSEGWHCLEVGAGAGSIAEWLCQRVGRTGRVFATDVETRFLDVLDNPNLEARKHDIVTDDLPEGAFDLAHARMVLSHLPGHEQALRKMVSALKPGGWLVSEEMDNISVTLVSPSDTACTELYMKVENGVARAMASRGHVYDLGRRLYGLLREHGLTDVQAEGRVLLRRAGAYAEVARLTVEQLREDIVESGLATKGEIEAYLALLDDPEFVALSGTLMAVSGRRPAV